MSSSAEKPLVILEIANNHMGDIAHGKALINAMAEAVDSYREYFDFAVKYQFRELDSFIHPDYKGSDLKFVKRFEETVLTDDEWQELIDCGRDNGFMLIITPFDEPSVARTLKFGVDIIKIASCSLADWPLLEEIANAGKSVIFSTAGANQANIDNMVSFFANRDVSATMMHCVGLYPTPYEQLNIGQIAYYKARYPGLRIGYSTHEDPSLTSTGGTAFCLGARVFEKHVALETDAYGKNAYSASPENLSTWLNELQQTVVSVGLMDAKVENTEAEVLHLRDLQRAMFVKNDVPANTVLTRDDLFFAIPYAKGDYVANDFSKYVSFTTTEPIAANKSVNESNCQVSDSRSEVLDIVRKVAKFTSDSGIVLPKGAILEVSHHYGLEKFHETGMSMVTVVNEEYCKKVLIMLPGQNHPEQYHEKKKETFHVVHGSVDLVLDGDSKVAKPGDVITIEPGVRHAFSTSNGCVIEEISSTHFVNDSYYTDPAIAENTKRKTFINFWTCAG